jgi:DNA modification methylase
MHAIDVQGPKTFEIVSVDGKRFVRCEHCRELVERSIVTHLKRDHRDVWKQYVAAFVGLRRQGYSCKKIMWHFGRAFSWTVVERALAEAGVPPSQRLRRLPLEPENFELEQTTIWSFPNRGKWAVHDSSYRGNWGPEVPRNLILRYTEPGDWVLDPFLGGGTTAIEATLLRRNFVGLDVNPAALQVARRKIRRLKARLRREKALEGGLPVVRVLHGDARRMKQVASESVKLVCAHPPYLNIVEYTRTDPADLSTITDPDRYMREMRRVALEILRCLRPSGVLAMLIGDVRRNGKIIPLGMKVLHALLDMFDLEEIVIKTQHNASSTHFYEGKSHSFLRIAHEYLLIMRKAPVGR